MGVWNDYDAQMEVLGKTYRERTLKEAKRSINYKLPQSLSYKTVTINGVEQKVSILSRSKLNEKKICAMPDEHLTHGGLVDFAGNKWLVTEIDADNELYEHGVMQQCNHLLKWIDKLGRIIEKWCIVEDGTNYLVGEKESNIITVGDSRIAITIPKDNDTITLGRGKRFLIDDTDSQEVLAYQITKSNRLYNNYNDNGIFRFILRETNMTDNDNKELRIADYYNYRSRKTIGKEHTDKDMSYEEVLENPTGEPTIDTDKGVWL